MAKSKSKSSKRGRGSKTKERGGEIESQTRSVSDGRENALRISRLERRNQYLALTNDDLKKSCEQMEERLNSLKSKMSHLKQENFILRSRLGGKDSENGLQDSKKMTIVDSSSDPNKLMATDVQQCYDDLEKERLKDKMTDLLNERDELKRDLETISEWLNTLSFLKSEVETKATDICMLRKSIAKVEQSITEKTASVLAGIGEAASLDA